MAESFGTAPFQATPRWLPLAARYITLRRATPRRMMRRAIYFYKEAAYTIAISARGLIR